MPIIPMIQPRTGLPSAQRMPVLPADTSLVTAGNTTLQSVSGDILSVMARTQIARDDLEATSLKTAAALDMERYGEALKNQPLKKKDVDISGYSEEAITESYIPRSQTYMEDLSKGYDQLYSQYSKLASNPRVLQQVQAGLLKMGKTALISGEKYTTDQRNLEDQAMVERNVDRVGKVVATLPGNNMPLAKKYIDSVLSVIDSATDANIWGSPIKAQQYRRTVEEGLYHQYGTNWANTDSLSFVVSSLRGENPLKDVLSAEKFAALQGHALAAQKALDVTMEKEKKRISGNIEKSLIGQVERGLSVRDKLVDVQGNLTDLGHQMASEDFSKVLALERNLENEARTRIEKTDESVYMPIRGDIAEGKYSSVPQLIAMVKDKQITPADRRVLINELEAYIDRGKALRLAASNRSEGLALSEGHRAQDQARSSRERVVSDGITNLKTILNPQGQMLGQIYNEGLSVIAAMAALEMRQTAEREKDRSPVAILNEVMDKYIEKTIRDLPAMGAKSFDNIGGAGPVYRSMDELKQAFTESKGKMSREKFDQLAPLARFIESLEAQRGGGKGKTGPTSGSDKAKDAGSKPKGEKTRDKPSAEN